MSSAVNDSGLVDEGDAAVRAVPFENYGVIGEWEIQLPADPSKGEPTAFDYSTITDVVLSIRYSARDGGERLRRAAMDSLMEILKEANASGAGRLFSIRHDFPDAWAKFKAAMATPTLFAPLEITLSERHYPFWARNGLTTATRSMLLAPGSAAGTNIRHNQVDVGAQDTMAHLFGEAPQGVAGVSLQNTAVATPKGTNRWLLSSNAMSDLWLFVGWKA